LNDILYHIVIYFVLVRCLIFSLLLIILIFIRAIVTHPISLMTRKHVIDFQDQPLLYPGRVLQGALDIRRAISLLIGREDVSYPRIQVIVGNLEWDGGRL
jgi:hypothetical protein